MSGRQKESLICCKAEKGCCTRWANLHAAHRPVATLFLRQRMGQWRPTFARDRRWPAYQTRYWLFIQSARTPTLFHAHSDSLQGRLPSRSFNAQPTLRTNNPLAYEGVAPAEFQAPRHGLIPAMCSINFFRHDDSDAIPNLPSTIFAHLDQLEPWESSLFPYVMPMANPLTLKEHLEDPESGPLFRKRFVWMDDWLKLRHLLGRQRPNRREKTRIVPCQRLRHACRPSIPPAVPPFLQHYTRLPWTGPL